MTASDDQRTESTDPRQRWNERYTRRGVRPFPDAPSEWLAEHRSLLVGIGGGRALDVACGEGRNAAYLASLGFEVDAVDISDVVIDALRSAAAERGLAVHARRRDLEREGLPAARYHVIVQISYLQRDLFGKLSEALAPGGILIIETVTTAHLEELGGSLDPCFVLERNELPSSFPDLQILHHHEGIVERSGKPRGVASLVARRGAAHWHG